MLDYQNCTTNICFYCDYLRTYIYIRISISFLSVQFLLLNLLIPTSLLFDSWLILLALYFFFQSHPFFKYPLFCLKKKPDFMFFLNCTPNSPLHKAHIFHLSQLGYTTFNNKESFSLITIVSIRGKFSFHFHNSSGWMSQVVRWLLHIGIQGLRRKWLWIFNT